MVKPGVFPVTFSVVLPTYNERDNIGSVIDRVLSVMPEAEIVVVDDASPDGTAAVVRPRLNQTLKLLERPRKFGLASAIIDGVRFSSGRMVAVMDADGSHDPAVLGKMKQALEEGADLAIGSRFTPGGGLVGWPRYRRAMSWLATVVAQGLLGVKERDPLSGYFAIQRPVFDRLAPLLRPRGYKILLEIIVRGAPLKTQEIGFVFQDRKYGKSKLSWRIAREYGTMIWSLLFRSRR